MRIDKNNYYLNIAEAVVARGTCIRRNFGAVIVNHDEIVSTGYVGSPRGRDNCCDRGERYELCRSVHAEQNAIISAARRDMIGSTLYLVGLNYEDNSYIEKANPCSLCKRMIINAGISKIVIRDSKDKYREIDVKEYIDNDDSLEGIRGY